MEIEMTCTYWRGPGHNLETLPDAEKPEQSAQRFYGKLIREGYHLAKMWMYREDDSHELYWLVRFEAKGKKKQPRALMRTAEGEFFPCKPDFQNGAPLLNLQILRWNLTDTIWVVEGEKAYDMAESWGLLATTWAGGASTIHRTNWTPLAGRKAVLWADNEQAGIDAVASLLPTLRAQGTIFARVDVEALGIRRHGDIVDWIDQMWKADPTESTWELRVWSALDHLPMVIEA